MNSTYKVYAQKQVAEGFGIDAAVTGNVKYRKKLRRMALTRIRGDSVVDVGCGNGLLLRRIHGKKLTGVDFSPEMLKQAYKRQPDATYVRADAARLPFCDRSYDTAVCIDMLHHLNDDNAQIKAIKELLRVSRKRVIFEGKTRDRLALIRYWTNRLFSLRHNTAKTPLAGMHYHNTSMKKLKRFLKPYDYRIERVSCFVDWKMVTVKC